MDLALPALYSILQPIPAIQAVLLLCSWPMPTSTLFTDPSHALAGAAMQLAIQNGLHILCREQDFARRPTKKEDDLGPSPAQSIDPKSEIGLWSADGEIVFRIRLWVHCVTVFQW
jgi:transcriptional regulatory protein LEU3